MLGTLNEHIPLEQDKRRLSLEGAMVATKLGVVLLYLIQEAEAAPYLSQEEGNRIQDGITTADPAEHKSRQGKINIKPLDEVEAPQQNGTEDYNSLTDNTNDIGANNNVPAVEQNNQTTPVQSDFDDNDNPRSIISGNTRTNLKARSTEQSLITFDTQTTKQVDQDRGQERFQQFVIDSKGNTSFVVIVKSDTTVNSRSVNGMALINETLRQTGIQDNRITLDPSAEIAIEILSDQQGQYSAKPFESKAITRINNDHTGSLRSIITGAKDININVNDWVRLAIDASEAEISLINNVTGIESTSIQSSQEDMLANIRANSDIEVWVAPTTRLHDQELKIITSALRDSLLKASGGDDIFTIVSSINGSLRDYSQILRQQQDDYEDQQPAPSEYGVNLHLSSQGLNNTTIHTGAGNDHLTIAATIDPNLVDDLERLAKAIDSEQANTISSTLYATNELVQTGKAANTSQLKSVQHERIAAINSAIDMGDGNDVLKVTGQIINSTIDMGKGINHVILEDNIDAESTIHLGDSGSQIEYRSNMNSRLRGGEADETFLINKSSNQGYIDGQGGSDTLRSQSLMRKVLVLSDDNQGTLEGVQFKGIENVDLGPGDDIVIVDFKGSLTGKLLGGEGLDRLDFSNWQNPISVDLDAGISTGINGDNPQGAISFEQVTGGEGSDFLASTGAMNELKGSGGNDVLFHQWSPWRASNPGGTELYGNDGQDIFVMVGLNQSIPSEWDGLYGLPKIKDLDLSTQPTVSGFQARRNDSIGLLQTSKDQDGKNTTNLQLLTPSGLEGIGDATKIPIASIETLMLGAANTSVQQLAIGLGGNEQQSDMMYLIGRDNNSPMPIAYVEGTGLSEIT